MIGMNFIIVACVASIVGEVGVSFIWKTMVDAEEERENVERDGAEVRAACRARRDRAPRGTGRSAARPCSESMEKKPMKNGIVMSMRETAADRVHFAVFEQLHGGFCCFSGVVLVFLFEGDELGLELGHALGTSLVEATR